MSNLIINLFIGAEPPQSQTTATITGHLISVFTIDFPQLRWDWANANSNASTPRENKKLPVPDSAVSQWNSPVARFNAAFAVCGF